MYQQQNIVESSINGSIKGYAEGNIELIPGTIANGVGNDLIPDTDILTIGFPGMTCKKMTVTCYTNSIDEHQFCSVKDVVIEAKVNNHDILITLNNVVSMDIVHGFGVTNIKRLHLGQVQYEAKGMKHKDPRLLICTNYPSIDISCKSDGNVIYLSCKPLYNYSIIYIHPIVFQDIDSKIFPKDEINKFITKRRYKLI